MICKDKAACTAIDEELAKGGSGAYVARLMTLRGFSVTAPTVVQHRKHAVTVPSGVAKAPKDFAIMVRDKAAELFNQAGEDGEGLSLANRAHVPGILAGLRAQSEINKQAAKTDDRKTAIALAMILSGASQGMPPEHALGDGKTIEGEFEELDSDIIALTAADDDD